MKRLAIGAAAMFGLALAAAVAPASQAADLQVLAGGGMTGPLKELGTQFESATGHKVVIRFGTTPELIKLATAGGPFDIAVVPREVFKDDAAKSKVVPGPTIDIARVGLGVAVRAGAARPDIATAEALKQTLLKAQSIATVPASAAGAQVLRAPGSDDTRWSGRLTRAGTYVIAIGSTRGSGRYSMDVKIE